MKRKICVVVTARPSYSRVKSLLAALKQREDCELQVVVTSSALVSRYGNVSELMEAEGFPIDARVCCMIDGESPMLMVKTTGLAMIELASVFERLQPDLVVTIADRYETLANAVSASYMNIPVAHIQGGELTGSIDEKVRHANTKLSDIHLVSTAVAAHRVIQMGENPDSVFNTGCPSLDLAVPVRNSTSLSFDPVESYCGVGADVRWQDGYVVVLQHPVTTEHDHAREHITQTLSAVEQLGLPTLWFWPNVDAGSDGTSAGIRRFRETHQPKNIRFFKNMAPLHFLELIKHSQCLIGNSSAGIREASFLGVPTVDIGSRQSNRERGENTLWVDHSVEQIVSAVQTQLQHGGYAPNNLYGDGRSGIRMADIVSSIPLQSEKRWFARQAAPEHAAESLLKRRAA